MCIRVYMYIHMYTIGHDVTGKNEIFHATIKRLKAYKYIYIYMVARVRFICIYTNPIQAPSFCIRTRSTLKKHRVSLIIRYYEKPVSLWIRLDNYDSTRSHETIHEKVGYGSSFSRASKIDATRSTNIWNCEYGWIYREKNEKRKIERLFIRCYINSNVNVNCADCE